MFEQMNSQVLSSTKQFAETMVKFNAIAVDSFEKMIDIQLKSFEERANVFADFMEQAAVVRDAEGVRAFLPKSVSMVKNSAESNIASSQQLAGVFTKGSEQVLGLVKGQVDVANEAMVNSSKVASKK